MERSMCLFQFFKGKNLFLCEISNLHFFLDEKATKETTSRKKKKPCYGPRPKLVDAREKKYLKKFCCFIKYSFVYSLFSKNLTNSNYALFSGRKRFCFLNALYQRLCHIRSFFLQRWRLTFFFFIRRIIKSFKNG
jgi:hypothetical protein